MGASLGRKIFAYYKVSVTQEDLRSFMEVLRNNVSEQSVLVEPVESDQVLTVCYHVHLGRTTVTLRDTEQGALQPMDSDPEAFCQLETSKAAIAGFWRSDTSQKVTARLWTLTVDDTRPCTKPSKNRLISPRQLKSGQATSNVNQDQMVLFEYEFSSDGKQKNHLEVNEVYVDLQCSSLWSVYESLLSVYEFFSQSLWPHPNHLTPCEDTTSKEHREDPAGGVDLTIVATHLEVVLSADPGDPHSERVVIKADVDYRYVCREKTHINVTGLGIDYRRRDTCHTDRKVLSPCDVDVSYSCGNVWDMKVTDTKLRLSPASIRTILSVFSAFTGQHKADPVFPEPADHSNLWDVRPLTVNKWLEQDKDDDLWSAYPIDINRPPEVTYRVDALTVGLIFEEDGGITARERLRVWTRVKGELIDVWQPQRRCNAEVTLKATCFNEKLGTWEPLLEPWEVIIKTVDAYSSRIGCGKTDFKADRQKELENQTYNLVQAACTEAENRPCQLKASAAMDTDTADDEVDGAGDDSPDAKPNQEPAPDMCSYIVIISKQDLKLNLNKNSLEIMKEVTESFKPSPAQVAKVVRDKAQSSIHNQLGVGGVVVAPEHFTVSEEHLHNVTLVFSIPGAPSKGMCRGTGHEYKRNEYHTSNAAHYNGITDGDKNEGPLNIKIDGFNELGGLTFNKAITQLKTLSPSKHGKEYSILYDVKIEHGQHKITLRSPLQIQNHLPLPIELHYVTADLPVGCHAPPCSQPTDQYTRLTVVGVGCVYPVPLYVSHHCKLFVAAYGYNKATTGMWWRDLVSRHKELNILRPLDPRDKPVFMKVVCSNSSTENIPDYSLHLYPPITIHNLLPCDMNYSFRGSSAGTVRHGEKVSVCHEDLTKPAQLYIQLPDYPGGEWQGTISLNPNPDKVKTVTLHTTTDRKHGIKELTLGVHVDLKTSLHLCVHAFYLITNKTGLPIRFRRCGSKSFYGLGNTSSNPSIFNFKDEKDAGNKGKLCVEGCSWSTAVSLDMVGCANPVTCHDKHSNRKYWFLVETQWSITQLTKMVAILPYFMMKNGTPYTLQFKEEGSTPNTCLSLGSNKVAPFWPETDSMTVLVECAETGARCCQPFSLRGAVPPTASAKPPPGQACQSTVLKMTNGTGLVVDMSGGREGPVVTTLLPYQDGDSPVRLENLCQRLPVTFWQEGEKAQTLVPLRSVLYTWDVPSAGRVLRWSVSGYQGPIIACINEDYNGEVHQVNADPAVGSQPTTVYWVSYLDGLQRALLFTDKEHIARRASKGCEAERAALSIVISLDGVEVSLRNHSRDIAVICLKEDPVTWTQLTPKAAAGVEKVYKDPNDRARLDSKRDISCRQRHPGVWVHYRHSCHHEFLQTRLQKVRVYGGQDPQDMVLGPADSGQGMPFVELSLMMRRDDKNGTQIDAVKYCNLVIQEFKLQLDRGFCLSLWDLVQSEAPGNKVPPPKPDPSTFRPTPHDEDQLQPLQQPGRVFFERFLISEVKMRLSLSMGGEVHRGLCPSEGILSSSVLTFLGSHVVNIKDAALHLDAFSRHASAHTWHCLLAEMHNHFRSKTWRQFYKFLQGVDLVILGRFVNKIKQLARRKDKLKNGKPSGCLMAVVRGEARRLPPNDPE